MKRIHLVLLMALGLVAALALGLLLRGFVGATIATPILYALWMAQLVFGSVPGWLWWAWFLVIALVIALRSLRTRDRSRLPQERELVPKAGPTRVWAERLRTARQGGDYFRWQLARDMADLALRLSPADRMRNAGVNERHQHLAGLNAPPDVAAFLENGLGAPPWQPNQPLERITRFWRPQRETSPLDLDPGAVVAFLEAQLEKKNDD